MTLKTLLAAALAASTTLAQGLAYPAGLQPGDQYRILMVTDSTRDATATDIGTYDAFVTSDAAAVPFLAALNATWRACASTTSIAARDHTGTASSGGVPIFRPDGVRLADDYDHLWGTGTSAPLLAAPEVTASGALASDLAWTGTVTSGSTASWPLGGVNGQAMVGSPAHPTSNWVLWGTRVLTENRPLYGLSDVLTVPYPDYPRDLKPGDRFRILFVTDAARDATSADIQDYDDFVTADAQAVPALQLFQTNWRAVASTPSVSATVHTETSGSGVPIYRPDGTRLSNGYPRLWNHTSPLLAPPNVTASGAVTSRQVWTGSSTSGVGSDPLGGSNGRATSGTPTATSYPWIWFNISGQATLRPLYGISDVITVPEPRLPQGLQPGQPYRVLFVTDGTRDATSANITDYDDFVAADAEAVPAMRLYDTGWLAVASTPSVSAADHTGTAGGGGVPIYRPDGTRVANDYANLWGGSGAGQLQAPPNVTASGAVTSAFRVWCGAQPLGGISSDPLGGVSGMAYAGSPNTSGYGWVFGNRFAQTTDRPLYGISEVLYVPYPAVIGTSCGSATLSRDTLPVLGTSFRCTLSGVPQNGIGAVLVDLDPPTAGTPQPTPPFLVGCTSYLSAPVTLGITLQQSHQFAVAIPNDPIYVGLPITMQGAAIDLSTGEVTSTNAIAARVRD